MSRKRLALLALFMAAALAAAGVAAAHRGAPSVQSVNAAFDATTVSQHSPDHVLGQRRRHVPGDEGDVHGNGDELGPAARRRAHDPCLEPGRHHERRRSPVRQLPHQGHRQPGPWHTERGDRDGEASGLARGFVRQDWGHVVASLGATFDPTAGFSLGFDRRATAGAGIPPLRSLVPSSALAEGADAEESFRGAVRTAPAPDHVIASTITKAAKTTLITPFIVKNAASSRRRSPGRTRECSYASSAATVTTPSQ